MRPCSRCLRKNQAQYCIDGQTTTATEHGPPESSKDEDPNRLPQTMIDSLMPSNFAHVLSGSATLPSNGGLLEPRKRRREVIDRACTACRRSKKKCDGNLPCSRCAAVRRDTCSYAPDPAPVANPHRPRLCHCVDARSCACFTTPRHRAITAPPRSFTSASQRCSIVPPMPAAAPLDGRGGTDGDESAALAALLPFAEVGWRPADAARWLDGLPAALRGALREAGAVARLAASFDALGSRPFAIADSAGPLSPSVKMGGEEGESSDDDAGAAAARAYEGHPTVGVFWARCAGGGHISGFGGRRRTRDGFGSSGGERCDGTGAGGQTVGRGAQKAELAGEAALEEAPLGVGTGDGAAQGDKEVIGDGVEGRGSGGMRYANERFAAMLGLERRDL